MRTVLFMVFRRIQLLVGGTGGRGYASLPVIGAVYRGLLRALKPAGLRDVQYQGATMRVNADDPLATPLLLGTDYNGPEMELVRRHLRPGMIAVDAGANIGCFSVVMSQCVGPQGRVVAFEPGPANHALLTHNIEVNGYTQTVAERQAVADEPGEATLHMSDSDSGYHSLSEAAAPDASSSVTVRTTSLDAYFAEPIPAVDFVKLDVQGAEMSALRGMRGLLTASPDMTLITELDVDCMVANGDDPREYLQVLVDHGFRLHHISHDPRAENPLPELTVDGALALQAAEGRHINLYCPRTTERG